jgi:hypothetical protein
MNLIKELGAEYVDQFYRNAMFEMDGKIVRYGRHADADSITCHAFSKDAVNPTWRVIALPADKITSMDVFGWPKLGYREFRDGDKRYVFYVAMTRSAMRGMREELIEFRPVPMVRLLNKVNDVRAWVAGAAQAQAIFAPKFTDFTEGMALLRAGVCCSFALSEDLAVCISTNQHAARQFDVLYKENVIGEVLADDSVVIPHKLAKRASSMQLFKGKVVF